MSQSPVSGTRTRYLSLLILIGLYAGGLGAEALAQQSLRGLVVDGQSGDVLVSATVLHPKTGKGTTTATDGTFEFAGFGEREYSLRISHVGYRTVDTTLTADGEEPHLIPLTPKSHELDEMIVTGSPLGRNIQYQPAQALNRKELQKNAAPSLGEILNGSPGVAMRSFGSAPARPVIRGLDGERVLVLQNSERMGDLSSTAHDHAVTLDPLAIDRVEVVKGPASLLYGSNALGGVVNLFSYELPEDWSPGTRGSLASHGATVNRLAAGLARGLYGTDRWALSGSLAYRDAANMRTPQRPLPSTYLNSYSLGTGFGYRAGNLKTGAAVTAKNYDYGLPEELDNPQEAVEVHMERYRMQSVTTLELDKFFEQAEWRLSANQYAHEEIVIETDPDGIRETMDLGFDQQSLSSSLTLRHRPVGIVEGAIGLSGQFRDMQLSGAEALSPDAKTGILAAYLYEEIDLSPRISLQTGSRVEYQHMNLRPNHIFGQVEELEERSDLIVSGSAGLNVRPSRHWEIGLQLARAYRVPTLEELYSDSPHLGANAYEIGDPGLDNEISLGTDLFLTYQTERRRLELSGYLNRIHNFIKYSPTGQQHAPSGLPIFDYRSSEARLKGFELAAESELFRQWRASLTLDYVHGTELTDERDPLPFMPPLRGKFTLTYETDRWWADSRVRRTQSQTRTAPGESSTGGYTLLGINGGYRLGEKLSLSLRLDNAFNTRYRDHLTRIEERNNPMPGRNLNLTLRWGE